MKKLMLVTGLFLLATNSSFADCVASVEKIAIREDAKQIASSSQAWSFSSSTKLVSKSSGILYYEVEVRASYNDGASTDEFPSSFYSVIAKGNEEACKAIRIAKH